MNNSNLPNLEAHICPSCRADDNNPYTDANGVQMRACGRCMIQWRVLSSTLPAEPETSEGPLLTDEHTRLVAGMTSYEAKRNLLALTADYERLRRAYWRMVDDKPKPYPAEGDAPEAKCPKCGSDNLKLQSSTAHACYVECHNENCQYDIAVDTISDLAAFFTLSPRGQNFEDQYLGDWNGPYQEKKLEEFVAQYAKLNNVQVRRATPKYDRYVEGASDFADFLASPRAETPEAK